MELIAGEITQEVSSEEGDCGSERIPPDEEATA